MNIIIIKLVSLHVAVYIFESHISFQVHDLTKSVKEDSGVICVDISSTLTTELL